MSKIVNCPLHSSLEFGCLLNVTIMLWNHNGLATSLVKLNIESELLKWFTIKREVKEKVSTLLLPEILKEKIIAFIRPIGMEIYNWKECQRKISKNKTFLRFCIARICWTPKGTVDYKKTAERLINEERLCITLRYKLACTYCCEKDIRVLWNGMNSSQKKNFCYQQKGFMLPGLINFWTLTLKGETHRLHDIFHDLGQSVSEHFFFKAIKKGNKIAVEYFYSTLTDEQKKEYMPHALNLAVAAFRNVLSSKSYYADIAYFLFSQIEDPEKIVANKKWTVNLLICFLNWPYQSHFMEIAEYVLTDLLESDFRFLLSQIARKSRVGFRDYNYSELFKECWQKSPNSYKRCIENMPLFLIEELFINDREIVSLILKDITYDKREELIFCSKGVEICVELAFFNNLDILKFFIIECLSTKEKLEKFRNMFIEKSFHSTGDVFFPQYVIDSIPLLISDIIQTHF